MFPKRGEWFALHLSLLVKDKCPKFFLECDKIVITCFQIVSHAFLTLSNILYVFCRSRRQMSPFSPLRKFIAVYGKACHSKRKVFLNLLRVGKVSGLWFKSASMKRTILGISHSSIFVSLIWKDSGGVSLCGDPFLCLCLPKCVDPLCFQPCCCHRLVLGQCMTIIRLKNPPASF